MGKTEEPGPQLGGAGVGAAGLRRSMPLLGRPGYVVREPSGRTVCEVLDAGEGQAMQQLAILAAGCLETDDGSPVFAGPVDALENGGFSMLAQVAELAGQMSGLRIGASLTGAGGAEDEPGN